MNIEWLYYYIRLHESIPRMQDVVVLARGVVRGFDCEASVASSNSVNIAVIMHLFVKTMGCVAEQELQKRILRWLDLSRLTGCYTEQWGVSGW